MIKIELTSNPFDARQRTSALLKTVLDELRSTGTQSCTIEFTFPGTRAAEGGTLRFRLTYLGPSRPRREARRPG